MGITNLKKEIIKSATLSVSANVIGKFIGIPTGIIVASILGPDGYGLLAIVSLILLKINKSVPQLYII